MPMFLLQRNCWKQTLDMCWTRRRSCYHIIHSSFHFKQNCAVVKHFYKFGATCNNRNSNVATYGGCLNPFVAVCIGAMRFPMANGYHRWDVIPVVWTRTKESVQWVETPWIIVNLLVFWNTTWNQDYIIHKNFEKWQDHCILWQYMLLCCSI